MAGHFAKIMEKDHNFAGTIFAKDMLKINNQEEVRKWLKFAKKNKIKIKKGLKIKNRKENPPYGGLKKFLITDTYQLASKVA